MSTRLLLAALTCLVLTACAAPMPSVSPMTDSQQFAYDLGRTHASFARCPLVASIDLNAHLESALLALRSRGVHEATETWPYFRKGLDEPAGPGSDLRVNCSCAPALVSESRLHNLKLFRDITTGRASMR
jgi:hypothetical protein